MRLTISLAIVFAAIPSEARGQTPRVPNQGVCQKNLSALATWVKGLPVIYYCPARLALFQQQTITFLFQHEEAHLAVKHTGNPVVYPQEEYEADTVAVHALSGVFSPHDWAAVIADIQRYGTFIVAQRLRNILAYAGILV